MTPDVPAIVRIFETQKRTTAERRRSFGLSERREALGRLSTAIDAHRADIVAALYADFGKPEPEVLLTEIGPVQAEISHAIRHLRRWMRPRRPPATLTTLGTKGRVRPEARGVCLIIAPWNYPFSLAIGPLVSCLAAGNSAIIKPSELTPATSAVIARIIAEVFPAELVSVIEGGKEEATALLALPFDHIFFTGSPAVGSIVMAAAARNLTSVTLELGGKSPTIVGSGADLEQAARWIAFGKFVNAGQTCIAPDHLFVHESIYDPFVKALRRTIETAYGDTNPAPDLARIITQGHTDRLTGLVRDAEAAGARRLIGTTAEGLAMPPTLIESITPEMRIDQEEIFGPILPIISYSDIDTVLARINDRPKPLALYIFERDTALIDHIIAGTTSGGVGVNLTLLHFSHHGLPFGGVNASGIGASHGEYGFRAFSHERAILENRFSPVPLFFAPYSERKRKLIAFATRMVGKRR